MANDGGYRAFRYNETGRRPSEDDLFRGVEFMTLYEVPARVAAWAVRARTGNAGPLFLRPTDEPDTIEIEERARRGRLRRAPPLPDAPPPAPKTTRYRLRACPRCTPGTLVWDELAGEYSCANCGWRG